jgi:LacI family transcriptional regulator
MPVTIKDIAAAAKVSKPTVSRILRGKHTEIGISKACADRVQDVARRLGYRPNFAARAISTGRFNNISLVLSRSPWRSSISSQFIEAIHDALADRQQHLTIARLTDEKLTDPDYVPRFLRAWSCDGLLLNYHVHIPPRLVELTREHNLPSIWLNCRIDADCVHPDDMAAGRAATEHLLALGHRRIAYVDWGFEWAQRQGTTHYSKEDRLAGYRSAMADAGLESTTMLGDRSNRTPVLDLAQQWVAQPDQAPTAVVCYSTGDARQLQIAYLTAGRRVPADLSLVSFGPPQHCNDDLLRFDLLAVPDKAMAQRSVERLIQKIDQPDEQLPPEAVPFDWDTKHLTAAPLRGESTGVASR